MPKENNKMQVDIDTLKKQNVNDLLSIKELYKRIEELGEKTTQIKYIDNTLVKKLKKEYENLKKIILDENIQIKLNNDIETINSQLNDIETINSQLNNDIKTINSKLDTKANLNSVFTMANIGQDIKESMTGGSVAVVGKNTILSENIVDKQITSEKMDFSEIEIITPTWINDSYVNENGGIAKLIGYSYSEPIQLLKGETILIEGQGSGQNISMISKKADVNIVKVLCVDSIIREYRYTATDDCNVVLSTKTDGFVRAIKFKNLNNFFEDIKEVNKKLRFNINPTHTSGKYINSSGAISSLSFYKYSEPIKLSYLETIEFTAKVVSTVSAISLCDSDGTNIKPILLGNGILNNYKYTNTSISDIYVIVCGDFREDFYICKTINIGDLIKEVKDIKNSKTNNININYSLFFKNVVCIGDSLTRGYQSEFPEGERNRDFNYPTALSRLNNWNVKNYGISGSTPTSWFNKKRDTNFSGYDCAIICLGRNGGLTSDEDKLNYKNIIDKLRTDNPHITIFTCSVPPSDYSNDEVLNNTIKSISSEKTTNFLDIYNNNILQDSKYRNDSCHFHALGYLLLANIINEKINDFIVNNESQFMQFWSDNTLADIIN